MAVIFRSTVPAQRIERASSEAGIAFASGESARCRCTLYGREASVLIPCLGDTLRKGEEEVGEARLPYVAITRAIDRLAMTYRKPSSFTRKIQDSIDSVR